MSISINTNIPSLQSQRHSEGASSAMRKDFEKLSSGKRINKASDDPAGLAIAMDLLADASTSVVATRNISDGVSMAAIADSALSTSSDVTTRMAELATQAANGTLSDSQRSQLNNEYQQLSQELNRVSQTTSFNGQQLLSGGNEISLQVGTNGNTASQISMKFADISSGGLGLVSNISTQESARAAIEEVKVAQETLSETRGGLGASVSRLEAAFENLKATELGERDAASRIQDADIAQQSSNLVADRIRQQMSVSVTAQANASPAAAMQLLS